MTDYILVPVEPTAEMVEAAEDAYMPFGDMDLALRMAILAAPVVQEEPVAYAVFAGTGNIRIWGADPIQAEVMRQQYGEQVRPLYAAPHPDVTQLVEALERARTYIDDCGAQAGAQSAIDGIDAVLAAYRKGGEE